jgi:hypothetical protein
VTAPNPADNLAEQLAKLLARLIAAREAAWDDGPAEQRLAALATDVASATGQLDYLVNSPHSPLTQLRPDGTS